MKLSVCMICKDEEKNIFRALNSIRDLADEIIVVDTGSLDNSIKIATSFNAKIIETSWMDDFSHARNLSIKYATSDYILILDCDEEIDRENCEKIRMLINDYSYFQGFYSRIININSKGDSTSAMVFRIFRNNKNFKFEGAIHEQILPSILREYSDRDTLATDVSIIHHGYKGEKYDLAKGKRNLSILLKTPKKLQDGFYHYNLGNEYIRISDNLLAKRHFEIANKLSKENDSHFPYLLINHIRLLMATGDFENGYFLFKKYAYIFPDFKELFLCGAILSYNLKKYKESKEFLIKYRSDNSDFSFYPFNNIEKDYPISLMETKIDREIFMEDNPPYLGELPLVVGILNLQGNHPLSSTISSIKKLNCKKVVFTKFEIEDSTYLKEKYNIEIIKCSKLDLEYSLPMVARKLAFISSGKFILLLNSTEELTYIGLLKLQQLLINPLTIDKLLIPVISRDTGESRDEIRLVKNSSMSNLILNEEDGSVLFKVEVAILVMSEEHS